MVHPFALSHCHVSAIERPSMPAAPLFALTRSHARTRFSRSSIASSRSTPLPRLSLFWRAGVGLAIAPADPEGFTFFACLRPPSGAVGVFVILDRLRTPPDASCSALHLGGVSAATTASADFWQELPPPDLPG